MSTDQTERTENIDRSGRLARALRLGSYRPRLARILSTDDTLIGYGSKHEQSEWENRLLAKPLAQSIQDRLRNRAALDREAAHDQIAGIAYTRQRVEKLKVVAGTEHYLVHGYGMRTITDLTPASERSGLRIDHDLSSPYMRDELDLHSRSDKPVESMFESLYIKQTEQEDLPKFNRNRTVFTNSANTAERLTAIYGLEWTPPDGKTKHNVRPQGTKFQSLKVGRGIHAMVFEKDLTKEQKAYLAGRMLPGIGATCSTHEVSKQLAPSEDPLFDPLLTNDKLENKKMLAHIESSSTLRTFDTLPSHHPMKTIGEATARMITGLAKAMDNLDEDKSTALNHNKLVDAALTNIGELMEVMPTYMDDIPRFSRLFDILVDEVYLTLAIARPYTIEDYKSAASASLESRAPTLKNMEASGVQSGNYLLSSGMDTIASGIIAAKEALGTRSPAVDLMSRQTAIRTRGANYFEVQFNMLGESMLGSDSPLIMGTLNPSTPTRRMLPDADLDWNVDTLIEGVSSRVRPEKAGQPSGKQAPTAAEPVVLVLDITVEKGGEAPELEKIISAFRDEIATGALHLVLCKSYQKFPSLGSGKAMAGNVSVVGKGPVHDRLSESLGRRENDEDIIKNDEAQLVTHFTKHEEQMERPMLARAARNASIIRGFLPEKVDARDLQFLYAKDLPFVAIPDRQIKLEGDGSISVKRPDELLQALGVESRFSFGFQNTSCLPFPDGVRIAAGQESEGEIIEKLYSVMKMVDPVNAEPISVATIDKLAGDAADAASKDLHDVLFGGEGTGGLSAGRRQDLVATLKRARAITENRANYLLREDTPPEDADKILRGVLACLHDRSAPQEEGYTVPDHRRLQVQLALVGRFTAVRVDDAMPEKERQEACGRQTAALLRERAQEAGGNMEWRKKVTGQLLKAGVLLEDEVVKGEGGLIKLFGHDDPQTIDKELAALLGSLSGKDLIMIGRRTIQPEALPEIQLAMTGQHDDVNRMHARVRRGWQNDAGSDPGKQSQAAAYLPNIVACCALTKAALFTSQGSRDGYNAMADAVIANGLGQLSPEARQRLLRKRAETALGRCADPNGKSFDEAVAKIEEVVGKQPYREGGANILKGSAMAKALGTWPKPSSTTENELQDKQLAKLVVACTGKLDRKSACDLLQSLDPSVAAVELLLAAQPEIRRSQAEANDARSRISTAGEELEILKAERLLLEVKFEDESGTIKHFEEKLSTLNKVIGKEIKKDKRKGEAFKIRCNKIRVMIDTEHPENLENIKLKEKFIKEKNVRADEIEATIKTLQEAIASIDLQRRLARVVKGHIEKMLDNVA